MSAPHNPAERMSTRPRGIVDFLIVDCRFKRRRPWIGTDRHGSRSRGSHLCERRANGEHEISTRISRISMRVIRLAGLVEGRGFQPSRQTTNKELPSAAEQARRLRYITATAGLACLKACPTRLGVPPHFCRCDAAVITAGLSTRTSSFQSVLARDDKWGKQEELEPVILEQLCQNARCSGSMGSLPVGHAVVSRTFAKGTQT
jgi:hypothetical protein